jgi:uncharacterized membrane protein YedE/YeeE
VSWLTALVAGLLFGAGLLVSGMFEPSVVLGFLDVGGAWNPALLFTMAGALLIAAPAFLYARRGGRAAGGERIDLPPRTGVTLQLVAGAATFGLGWGLSGICPGPALLLLTSASSGAIAFAVAMAAGMTIAYYATRRDAKTATVQTHTAA